MNRDFPMYEGDGFIRNPVALDRAAIDTSARRNPAVALGTLFARLFNRIDTSMRRAKYRELEKYLGESVDLADLERRLRRIGAERRDLLAQG